MHGAFSMATVQPRAEAVIARTQPLRAAAVHQPRPRGAQLRVMAKAENKLEFLSSEGARLLRASTINPST